MTAMAVDMDPALWGTLPRELLYMVFSRLSVAEISGLRLLSKEWKRDIDTVGSEFGWVLEATVYPRMFGLLVWKEHRDFQESFDGRVLDLEAQRWHPLELDLKNCYDPEHDIIMVVADAGLVCFAFDSRYIAVSFYVMNPLTKKIRSLPRICEVDGEQADFQSMMVQLTVDRQTQQYKVFVVGSVRKGFCKCPCAQVYDSKTNEWTIVGLGEQSWGRIFGCEYSDERGGEFELRGPCVYDFADGGLQYFGGDRLVPFDELNDIMPPPYAFINNHLFVLCGDTSPGRPIGYYISEYVLERNTTAWMKVQDIRNFPFENASNEPFRSGSWDTYSEEDYLFTVNDFILHACNGHLMVFDGGFYSMAFSYNLSTCQWQKLPEMWRAGDLVHEHSPKDFMCEFRWDTTP